MRENVGSQGRNLCEGIVCVCVRQQFVFGRNFGFPYTKRSDPSSYSPAWAFRGKNRNARRGVPFAHKLILCGGDDADGEALADVVPLAPVF